MRCSYAAQQLQLYIDKQLTLEEIRVVELHLSSCYDCRRELHFLEEVAASLEDIQPVAEPTTLTANIMRRVALDVRAREREQAASYVPLRPSLREALVAIVLATITTLGVILGQPSLRAVLPFANGHGQLTQVVISTSQFLSSVNSGTLTWVFWILGTLLGVCITLVLAGDEMRGEWLKAMTDRLPVW